MASDNEDIAVKAGELRDALARQTEKSNRLMQKSAFMTEALPDVKRKAEQASRRVSRIKQTKQIAGSENFDPEALQISKTETESKFISDNVQPRVNSSRKKKRSLF